MSTEREPGPPRDVGEVSQLLHRWAEGDRSAFEALIPLVYAELRKLAGGYLRHERGDHTLQPTALVHEAYFRLAGQERVAWANRTHFYAIAAQAMRRILVDYARRRKAARRGDRNNRISFELAEDLIFEQSDEILEIHDLLEQLQQLSPRQARLVEMRFFGGLTVEEAADALEVSVPTAVREWRFARAWLRKGLGREDEKS